MLASAIIMCMGIMIICATIALTFHLYKKNTRICRISALLVFTVGTFSSVYVVRLAEILAITSLFQS